MQLSTFATIAAVLPPYVYAQQTTSPPPATTATDTCATITTQGSDCPALSSCIALLCLRIESVTLSCGCPSIFTSKTCATACPTGCAGTSYSTHFLPCPTTPSTSTSDTSTKSSKPTATLNPSPTTSMTSYGNSTVTTATKIGPTLTTSASPPLATANSAKKWGSDS